MRAPWQEGTQGSDRGLRAPPRYVVPGFGGDYPRGRVDEALPIVFPAQVEAQHEGGVHVCGFTTHGWRESVEGLTPRPVACL